MAAIAVPQRANGNNISSQRTFTSTSGLQAPF
jgi:hypothetical protein